MCNRFVGEERKGDRKILKRKSGQKISIFDGNYKLQIQESKHKKDEENHTKARYNEVAQNLNTRQSYKQQRKQIEPK